MTTLSSCGGDTTAQIENVLYLLFRFVCCPSPWVGGKDEASVDSLSSEFACFTFDFQLVRLKSPAHLSGYLVREASKQTIGPYVELGEGSDPFIFSAGL